VTDERTVAQRLVQAKKRLRDEGVQFVVPGADALPARLAAILEILYIVFASPAFAVSASQVPGRRT
jgi:RNA polymerase sigma-70 factor (ECF subfamily)